MEYSVGDIIRYVRSHNDFYTCKVVKIGYGYAWWCLDGEHTEPSPFSSSKPEQFVRLESINCDWTNSCISDSVHIKPHKLFTRKNIKKHEWI